VCVCVYVCLLYIRTYIYTCTQYTINTILSDLLYQNLFKPDQLGKSSNNAGSARATSRPSSIDGGGGMPMAKHAINKSSSAAAVAAAATDEAEVSKIRAVVADVSGTKSSLNEKRAEKCKEKCPANIKECCRNAIAGIHYSLIYIHSLSPVRIVK